MLVYLIGTIIVPLRGLASLPKITVTFQKHLVIEIALCGLVLSVHCIGKNRFQDLE